MLVSLLAQFLTNPPAGYSLLRLRPTTDGPKPKPAPVARRDLDWHEMLRTGQFYQLWLMFVLSASAGLLIIGNITLIAQDQVPHWDKAFLSVMVVAIFNTCGRFLSGFLSDRIGRTNTMVLAFALQAINMFMFIHYTTPGLLLFGSRVHRPVLWHDLHALSCRHGRLLWSSQPGRELWLAVHCLRGRGCYRVSPWGQGS